MIADEMIKTFELMLSGWEITLQAMDVVQAGRAGRHWRLLSEDGTSEYSWTLDLLMLLSASRARSPTATLSIGFHAFHRPVFAPASTCKPKAGALYIHCLRPAPTYCHCVSSRRLSSPSSTVLTPTFGALLPFSFPSTFLVWRLDNPLRPSAARLCPSGGASAPSSTTLPSLSKAKDQNLIRVPVRFLTTKRLTCFFFFSRGTIRRSSLLLFSAGKAKNSGRN
mmetsp:Transcript_2086/g.3812  ORF Transcript_2086/g.3812 Transcript_2086/m.3812 type:complete len:223 (-) Transcript_2086:599-1267(-)